MRLAVAIAAAVLVATQAQADMFQDGSNAADAVKFPGSLSLNGTLTSPYQPTTLAVKGGPAQKSMAEFMYGAAGAPLAVDPGAGYPGFLTKVYGNPGAGTADAFTTGIWNEAHLSAGSRGVAVGLAGFGHNDGTWTPGGFNAGAIGVWGQAQSTRGGTVWGLTADCSQSVTAGGGMVCVEIDTRASASVNAKYGLAINSATGDTGAITGTIQVQGSGVLATNGAAIFVQGIEAGPHFPYILLTIQQADLAPGFPYQPPVPAAGSLWRAGGFTVVNGLDWPDMTFTGYAINTTGKIKGQLTTDATYIPGTKTPTGYMTIYDSTGTAYRVNACAASACP